MNGAIKFALGLASMPPAEIADLEAKLPGLARIAAAAKQLEPLLREAEPHAEALLPLLTQAMPHLAALAPLAAQGLPLVKQVWPDIVAATPTVEQLIAFVGGNAATRKG